ncbi:AfsR/SARP family transcriptional regulator [Nocardioides aequoreus]|uniref:AfsR/SARP family transcriptional regulator n=1 Tax=Nocardioides aequoreus TaxID=397278 RepID=UPI00068CB7BF|nr:BTAD domain-containing putative transcriptional regulator [Nocardioides aequoreus]
MQVNIFGSTTVVGAAGPVRDLGGAKPRQILEILAVAAGAPVSKEQLADLLWEGRPPRSHLATLESYVCVLRRSLGGRGRESGIVTVQQGYRIDPVLLEVDLARFRSLLQEAHAAALGPQARLRRYEEALDLAVGDLLADDLTASWASSERDRVRGEVVAARSGAAALALALDLDEAAIRHARAALVSDPHAEEAVRTLMSALHRSGRRPEALRSFFDLRHRLGEDLGVDPSRETTRCYLQLLRDEGAADAGTDAREEVHMLVRLLRQAVLATPGVEVSQSDRAWTRLAAQLVPA